jgi:hypothetical protein
MLDEFKGDTRVVHCQREPYDVYIGRPSDWGNPFTHIKDRSTRAEFIVRNRHRKPHGTGIKNSGFYSDFLMFSALSFEYIFLYEQREKGPFHP